MTAYVDSSVLIRVVLRQPASLEAWRNIDRGVSSTLAELECLRTLDRFRVRGELSDRQVATHRDAFEELFSTLDLVDLSPSVLNRAARPIITELGSLDAIHLASALLYSELTSTPLVMATHDRMLARAARSHGLRVVGVPEME